MKTATRDEAALTRTKPSCKASLRGPLVIAAMFLCVGAGEAQQTQQASAADEATPVALELPPRTQGLRTLEVPEAVLDEHIPYFLLSGEDTQIQVELRTSLSRLVASTSRATGWLLGPFDIEDVEEGASPIGGAAIRLPVASLRSDTFADRLMQGPNALDAGSFPDIGFVLDRARDVEVRDSEANTTTFAATFEGRLQVKDQVVPITSAGEITFLLTTNATFSRGVGDMARVQGAFEVALTDLLDGAERLAGRFGSTVKVDYYLMFSTADPERPLLAPTTPEAFFLESRFVTALRDLGDEAMALAAGEELLAKAWDDPAALQSLAQNAVFETGSGHRFLGLAKRAAERVVELSGESPPALTLNLLARIASQTGDGPAAVRLQQRALEAAAASQDGAAQRALPQMQRLLELYRKQAQETGGE